MTRSADYRGLSRLTPCPPKLQAIIELANLVPASADLPNPMALFCPEKSLPPRVEATELVEGLLRLPKAFQEKVLDTLYRRCRPESDQRRELAGFGQLFAQRDMRRYEDVETELIYTALGRIKAAAERNQFMSYRRRVDFAEVRHNEPLSALLQDALNNLTLVFGLIDLAELYSFVWRSRDLFREIGKKGFFDISSRVSIDDQGLVQIDKDLLEDSIEGVKAARLRECAICRRVFWVGRVDQLCCTPRCNHIRHSRRSRLKQTSNRKGSDQQKLSEVRKAIERGALTPAAISVTTALPLDEANRLINLLTNRGEADWNARDETLYLKDKAKKEK